MAVDYFLKIDGIQGESADDKHKNDIELQSWSWGAQNVGTFAAGGGGGAGKVNVGDFVVMKYIDKASPKLIEACTTGKHISSATLYCRKAGGTQQEYLKITLTDVLVSNYETHGAMAGRRQHSPASTRTMTGTTTTTTSSSSPAAAPGAAAPGSGGVPVPLEQFSLNFSKIEYEYKEQDSKGGLKGPVKTVWDVKANKAS
jgi:type VI secretion system secreted protein Hcp